MCASALAWRFDDYSIPAKGTYSVGGLTLNRIAGHRDGIYLEFVHGTVVAGNTSERNLRYGLHFMYSDDCRYIENVFRANLAGVAVMYTKRIAMIGNRFEDNWGTVVETRLGHRVVKCGIPGSGTRQQLVKARRVIARMQRAPELVLREPRGRADPADLRALLAIGEGHRAGTLLHDVTAALEHRDRTERQQPDQRTLPIDQPSEREPPTRTGHQHVAVDQLGRVVRLHPPQP